MVKAFSNADRVRVHPTQTQMLALAAAIAAGADARLGGVPVDSLDCTNCRAMVDAVMLQLFHSIGTLRCGFWIIIGHALFLGITKQVSFQRIL